MTAILELDHVSFTYERSERSALSDITLSIGEGAFVGVIGPSGAGKSTLASILSGAIPHHYAGRLYGATRVAGMDTCEVSMTDIAGALGSVLQDIDAQMVASNVEDELLFGLENFGAPHEEIETRMTNALEAVGIGELRHREIATLSGGQKQKVAIAAILALRPRVLVLDEPTAALDPMSARTVFEVLRQANGQLGITVVVIEQSVSLLSEFCDRILVLDRGRMALDGTPHEVFSHTDELRRIGVDTPRTVRISNSLGAERPCLNVDEAFGLLSSLVGKLDSGADVRGSGISSRAQFPHEPKSPVSSSREPGLFEHRMTYQRSPHAHMQQNASCDQSSPVLSLQDTSFSYPNGGASVSDLSLNVYPGEIVAVVGENGAGKTTLTKLVNGLLRPASGSIRIAGLDTRDEPVSAVAAHVSTLFQNPDRQLCKNTVLEEVAFGLELQGVDATGAQTRAQAVIDRFDLPAQASPFSLSRGERQMVALASVVVTSPDLIILDEPTSGLDYRECMTVMETVREMAEAGSAVLLVCHDMEVVSDFAQRVVVMANGRILAEGPTNEIFQDVETLRAGHVAQPHVLALSQRLAASLSPAFAGISEVSELVSAVQELMNRA